MHKNENKFIVREFPPNEIQQCFNDVENKIRPYLPNAEIIHVGSTAVPGCLTKGDMDIVVRVAESEFINSIGVLGKIFGRSDRNPPMDDYAEFDFFGKRLPVSIQLVSINGAYDDFHIVTTILNRDKKILQKFNELKITFNGCDMEDYRQAKNKFFKEIIAAYNTGTKTAG